LRAAKWPRYNGDLSIFGNAAQHGMNKDLIKGAAMLVGVALALALFVTLATEHGPQKLSCIVRAILRGVALSNVHVVCGL
jgi:hypothetical protein